MSTINDLNCTFVYYTEKTAKIARIPVNSLMPNPVTVINQYWDDGEQTYYTDVGVEYDGQTILKYSLRD